MEFRRKKLYLALAIMAVGMAADLIWQGCCHGFSHHTFFYSPRPRFVDFTDALNAALSPCPYLDHFAVYFPFAYGLLRYFALLGPATATVLFIGLTSLGLAAALFTALRPITTGSGELLLCGTGLLILSHPYDCCLEGGNIEMLMVLLVSVALLYFRNRRWIPGLSCLFPAISLKLYPILLMVLFVRPNHRIKIAVMGAGFLLLNLVCLTSFDLAMEEKWRLWRSNLQFHHDNYLIGNWGMDGSASAWNTCKALFGTASFLFDPANHGADVTLPMDLLQHAFGIYVVVALAVLFVVSGYVALIEREFFRKVILLLLLVTLAVPSGADYRLLYAHIALVVLILLPRRHAWDLVVAALLAFVCMPKDEIVLSYLGPTDTGVRDISAAILINPPCLLLAVGLLVHDGLRQATWRLMNERLFRIFNLR